MLARKIVVFVALARHRRLLPASVIVRPADLSGLIRPPANRTMFTAARQKTGALNRTFFLCVNRFLLQPGKRLIRSCGSCRGDARISG